MEKLKTYDLNCNIFDLYNYDGLSMQELLCQFFTKINECVDFSNSTLDLCEWLVNEGLKQEVAQELVKWLNDGTLENVINVSLFENLDKKIDSVVSQINITPDNFVGTDVEKIQKSLDYCIENDIKTIQLNRTYDLTGGTIYYNGGYSQPPTFKDGILIKNDSGFMFSRLADNNESNTPLFFNVSFRGDTNSPCYIIDGDKMIRQNFESCNFKNISLITTSSYIQSLRLNNCEMTMSPNIFINCSTCYDVNITNNRFEESHKTLLKCYSDSTGTFANNSTRITNNLVEGYVYEPPIILSSAYGLVVENNYFEYNNSDIEFVMSTGINVVNGSISNNSFFKTKSNYHIKANGNNTYTLYLNNNSTNITFEGDKSFTVGLIRENIKNTYLNACGRLTPQGTTYNTDGVSYTVFNNNGKCAIRIKPRSNTSSQVMDTIGRNYLINFSGTYGSSIYYRATFTGILSVGGNWDSINSVTCRELTIDKLTSTNMNGLGGNNALWEPSYVTAVFENTQNNKIPSNEDSDIIITFTNIPYNSDYTRATVKNLEGLSCTSIYIEEGIQS